MEISYPVDGEAEICCRNVELLRLRYSPGRSELKPAKYLRYSIILRNRLLLLASFYYFGFILRSLCYELLICVPVLLYFESALSLSLSLSLYAAPVMA